MLSMLAEASGKPALTMCMGLGCNASAVVGCRIIDFYERKGSWL